MNISKIADPRFWAKWIASGAVSQPKTSECSAFGVAYYLRGSNYVTRGGTIDPWGTIRILAAEAPQWTDGQTLDACSILQPGLPIWSAKLVGLPSSYRASVESGHVVVRNGNRVVAKIHPRDCRIVDIDESMVDASGHLQAMICVKSDGINKNRERAFQQAEHGEMPCVLDNSMFVQVSKGLAGQKVVELNFGMHQGAVVFTRDGRQIPCKCHELLAFEKWGVPLPEPSPSFFFPDHRDMVSDIY